MHSTEELTVRFLKNLKANELIIPSTLPIIVEMRQRKTKLPMILIPVIQLVETSEAPKCITVSKMMIPTASFVIPSPTTTLKSFGY